MHRESEKRSRNRPDTPRCRLPSCRRNFSHCAEAPWERKYLVSYDMVFEVRQPLVHCCLVGCLQLNGENFFRGGWMVPLTINFCPCDAYATYPFTSDANFLLSREFQGKFRTETVICQYGKKGGRL